LNNISNIDDNNFEQEINKSDIPVLVDFWAEWCAPCKALEPIIANIAEMYNGKIKIYKALMDDCPKSINKYKVRALPTFLFFHNGTTIRKIGKISQVDLISWLNKILKSD